MGSVNQRHIRDEVFDFQTDRDRENARRCVGTRWQKHLIKSYKRLRKRFSGSVSYDKASVNSCDFRFLFHLGLFKMGRICTCRADCQSVLHPRSFFRMG